MKNRKTTRRAFMLSLLSLLLCSSMLVGTTFAWFTDSVTSTNNIIQAGNLDVDVYYGDPADKKSIEGAEKLFTDVTLWEPGVVACENVTVANLGTLAVKYKMSISFSNYNSVLVDGKAEYALPDILQVGLVPGGVDKSLGREAVAAAVTQWYPMEDCEWEEELLGGTNDETVGVVIRWDPSDEDNNWNLNNGKKTDDGKDHLYVDLGVTLVATQLASESDSFDNTYDKEAEYPIVVGGTLEEGSTTGLTLNAGRVTVTVPAGSPGGSYKLSVNSLKLATDANDITTLDTDFAVLKDGAATSGVDYQVELDLDLMSKIEKLTHKGEEITNYSYDPFTGAIRFVTDSFSPFAVEYDIYGREVTVDAQAKKIFSGYFEDGVNPAILDPSLLGDDSDYIAVDYVKDGVKHYAVSERATTIIVGDNDDGGQGYTFENGTYPVNMINNNGLYKVLSDLKSNPHSTVYILPGIYKETTTLTVASSMDIVGLGDAEDIQVVKIGAHSNTSKKPSNRHLFNCTNSNSTTYIQVTIRNLHLDATEKNSYIGKFFGKEKQMFEDNAAVQSIRRAMVKCYDLIVVKDPANAPSIAFYVNATNKDDAQKLNPAYMYVENCVVNAAKSSSVLEKSGGRTNTAYFFYDGLFYDNGAQEYNSTTNSSSYVIKNTVMDWNDWDWAN